jgi:hypothetical protein
LSASTRIPEPPPTADSTHIPESQRAAIVAVSGLQVGASKTVTFTLSEGLSGGTNTIYAVVDSDPAPTGAIQERRETDNISSPLVVEVVAGGGELPTPTPTATPVNPGSLVGRVRNEAGNPQANVAVWIIDEDDGSQAGITYSAFDGTYFFASVEAGSYTLNACIRIEDASNPGVFHDYWAAVPGVTILAGQTTTQNLFLELAPEGCSRP